MASILSVAKAGSAPCPLVSSQSRPVYGGKDDFSFFPASKCFHLLFCVSKFQTFFLIDFPCELMEEINCFQVYIFNYDDGKIVAQSLRKRYFVTSTDNMRWIYVNIPIAKFNDFIENFHDREEIDWKHTFQECPANLEEWMVKLLRPVVCWSAILSHNSFIPSLNLLREVKDDMDWVVFLNYANFTWSRKALVEFREHLIFTNKVIRDGKITKDSIAFAYTWGGKEHDLRGRFVGHCSISCSNKVEWSEEIIEDNLAYWDWDQLSSNPHIPFTISLISKFKTRWNWSLLTQNSGIPFCKELIKEFQRYWDWTSLSGDKRIKWTENLVRENIAHIDRKAISTNTNVDWKEVIWLLNNNNSNNTENSIDWGLLSMNESIPEEFYTGDFCERNIVWNRPLTYIPASFKIVIELSLCANKSVTWNTDFISRNIHRIDLWTIALFGKITIDAIIQYAAYLDEVRYYSYRREKFSDFPDWQVFEYSTGRENLKGNQQFKPDQKF